MRFYGSTEYTFAFSKEIFVKCPKCDGRSIVKTELGKYNILFTDVLASFFSCSQCGLSKKINDIWYGPYQGCVKNHCGFCGSKLKTKIKPTKKIYQKVLIRCDHCHQAKQYPVEWSRYRGSEAIDPYFGLDLWLQTEVKGDLLWAYNFEHIQYLRQYVSAEMREEKSKNRYTLVYNLPKWIKLAKNRALVLKKLDLLYEKLQEKR